MLKKFGPWFIVIILFLFFYPGDNKLIQLFAFYQKELTLREPYVQKKPLRLPSSTSPLPFINAESVLITHVPTFTLVSSKNEHAKRYPASTIKMLTALTAKRLYKLEDIVTIHQATPEGQIIGLTTGEQMSVENLLYATLIYSANDAAEALANNGNREVFLQEMQKTASELGMKDTTIKNPTGLDDDEQLTTAYDLTLAARAILNDVFLSKVISIREISIANTDFSKYYTLTSTNILLGAVAGVGGLKTGYTEKAGQNLISYFIYNSEPYIVVVLKSTDRFFDTKILTDWMKTAIAFKTFTY